MTRIGRRSGFLVHLGPASALVWTLGLVLGVIWPLRADAAKLGRALTSEDLTGRVVLDQNGQQLQLPTVEDRHPALPKGSTPAYLAIPLDGGEHLPGSIPVLTTGSQPGETTVGPLDFDALLKAKLDTTLNTSRLAVVDTPSRNYLVGSLPGRVHSVPGTASNSVNELSHLLSTSSAQWTKWTQSGMNELEKLVHISSSKTSSSKLSPNLQAQVLGSPLPAPIPEPSTWMVFAGLVLGAARLGHRLLRRVGTSD
jgi:hypothetical protein